MEINSIENSEEILRENENINNMNNILIQNDKDKCKYIFIIL